MGQASVIQSYIIIAEIQQWEDPNEIKGIKNHGVKCTLTIIEIRKPE